MPRRFKAAHAKLFLQILLGALAHVYEDIDDDSQKCGPSLDEADIPTDTLL
jgi:hypothetical protein